MKEILLKWNNHVEASNVDEVKDVGAELDISGKMNQIMEEKMANFSMSRVERMEEEMRIWRDFQKWPTEKLTIVMKKEVTETWAWWIKPRGI